MNLLLGSMVALPTGQTGCITGFYLLRSEAPELAGGKQYIPLHGEEDDWFRETSYCLARAGRGFARVIGSRGAAYWRLDGLVVAGDEAEIVFEK